MASFMVDPETGRKVLATRKRRGDGCHGRKNLWWKSHGDGFEVLCCRVCGRTHGERLRCFRCDGFKEETDCRECAVHSNDPDGPELACKGTGGMCCRCAGIEASEQEAI
jgi:hypothetical protein